MKKDDDKPAPATGARPASDYTDGELEQLKRIAMSHAPRQIDLEQLRRDIQSGDYTPDLKSLADRILSDPFAVEQLLAG